jgi:hypothetical protein
MGLVLNKTNKSSSFNKTIITPKVVKQVNKQLTAKNIAFLKSVGLTPTTNNGYPRDN